MTGAESDLEDTLPLDEGEDARHPGFPATQGDRSGDQVISEGKLMIEQFEEKSQDGFHGLRGISYEKNKGLTRCAVKPLPCIMQDIA